MLFFQILLDRQEFFEKETALKEEYNYELFSKNLQELSTEQDLFRQKIIELCEKYQKQNYRLSFLSHKELLKFVKSFHSKVFEILLIIY